MSTVTTQLGGHEKRGPPAVSAHIFPLHRPLRATLQDHTPFECIFGVSESDGTVTKLGTDGIYSEHVVLIITQGPRWKHDCTILH
jgi:hypothetical protein